MPMKPLLFALAAMTAVPAVAAPQLQPALLDSAAALSDPALSEIRGGQAVSELQFARNARLMVQQQFDVTARSINGIAGEQMDTWWASTGLELISANILR